MKTAVSLFSGCGGSDLGLISAGFNVLLSNDILSYAALTYRKNLPETDYKLCHVGDIKSFPRADVLAGCYPCQGFSQGGTRKVDRSINYLYREFDRALRNIKPKAFIVENVSGMTRSNNKVLLNNQLIRFRLAGYKVSYKTINAADYGVAQNRKRIFIVGIRSDFNIKYEFPKPTHNVKGVPHFTIKDALQGMPLWPYGEFCDQDFHWYYMSRNRRADWDEQSKTIVSNLRHIPLHPISPKLIKKSNDKWVFENNEPARRFSYKEAALLQGFGKNYTIPENIKLEQKYRIIGNAVPPPLFEAVVKALPSIW